MKLSLTIIRASMIQFIVFIEYAIVICLYQDISTEKILKQCYLKDNDINKERIENNLLWFLPRSLAPMIL